MNARENALAIIHFGRAERIVGEPPVHRIAYMGCHHESIDGSGGHECAVGSEWTDIWGVGFRKAMAGHMGFPIFHPLADVKALAHYRWPDPDDERICGRIYRQAAE
jgi:hypothetical protein